MRELPEFMCGSPTFENFESKDLQRWSMFKEEVQNGLVLVIARRLIDLNTDLFQLSPISI